MQLIQPSTRREKPNYFHVFGIDPMTGEIFGFVNGHMMQDWRATEGEWFFPAFAAGFSLNTVHPIDMHLKLAVLRTYRQVEKYARAPRPSENEMDSLYLETIAISQVLKPTAD